MKSYNKFIQISREDISFYCYLKNKTIIVCNSYISLMPSNLGQYYFVSQSKFFNKKDLSIFNYLILKLIKGYEK